MTLVKGSVKRTVVYWSSWALIACASALSAACVYRITRYGDVGGNALMLTAGALGGVATLAGVAYRKKQEALNEG